MSYWNYRVIARKYDDNYVEFGIYETYYDEDDKPHSISSDEMSPHGETLAELTDDLYKMKQALEKPVLQYEDF